MGGSARFVPGARTRVNVNDLRPQYFHPHARMNAEKDRRMLNRMTKAGWFAAMAFAVAAPLMVLAAPVAGAEAPPTTQAAAEAAELAGNAALAERFCEIGQNALRSKGITP